MFIVSKILHLFAQPLNGAMLLLVLGLYWGKRKPTTARRLVAGGLLIVALTGVTTLPEWLIGVLERQSPEMPADADLSGYAGMVVLGGALESGRVSAQHQLPLLNGGAERMTEAFAVWRRNPALQIVFTGGEGELFGTGPSEAERTRRFFTGMGLPSSALTLESQSRNTYENAVFTRQLPGIDPQKRWLLVTSAWHMPRSLAVFQKAGWNVTPYPVDFRTAGTAPLTAYSLRDGADRWELLLHELIGLVAYRISGRI